MEDAEFDYVTGQGRPGFPALLGAYDAASQMIASRGDAVLDIPYGAHRRQRMDLFPAFGAARATLVYFHAGYWQSRDKATFRFIAQSFNEGGLNVVLVNYPLCPEVTLAELSATAAAALAPIAGLAAGRPIVLSGHSAGGHLAVELAMRSTPARHLIAGVAGLSGVYDLRPLVETSLNRALALNEPAAYDASPVLRVTPGVPPAIFAVGAAETDAFRRQNRAMAAAWSAAGATAQEKIVDQADHFTILQTFTDRQSDLHRAVLALAEGPAQL